MTTPEHSSLPKAEFAFPGPLRDQLVAAILDGSKTSTTGLVIDFEVCGDELPTVGSRAAVVDSDEQPVGVIEYTEVRTAPLAEVDLQHAIDEGEGFTTVAAWRADHTSYWEGPEVRGAIGIPDFTVDDTTPLVLMRFRLLTPEEAAS
ncbi:RNA-binding protein [Kitasatospora sp. MMS16-BH015]|nr:RNA-binding protein [Kitasatospora sp. MMS16-BH015]